MHRRWGANEKSRAERSGAERTYVCTYYVRNNINLTRACVYIYNTKELFEFQIRFLRTVKIITVTLFHQHVPPRDR